MENSLPQIDIKQKVELYAFAFDLFNQGKSYPQVITEVEKYADTETATFITGKAENEAWTKLFDITKTLYSDGKTYGEVIEELTKQGEEEDIIKFAADAYYAVKTVEMENQVESDTNIAEGSMWVLISGVVIIVVFYFNASIFTKILWSMAFLGSLVQYLSGIKQRKEAKKIKQFFAKETNIEE